MTVSALPNPLAPDDTAPVAVSPGGTSSAGTAGAPSRRDHVHRAPGGIVANSAQVLATATTTNVTVISYSVPANTAAVGTVYQIDASGTGDNTAASPTFIFELLVGSTVLATITIPSITAAATNRAWFATGFITFRVIGASGKIVGSLMVLNEMASAVTGNVNMDSPIVNAGTFNTTGALTLSLAMREGATTAGNILRAEVASIMLRNL